MRNVFIVLIVLALISPAFAGEFKYLTLTWDSRTDTTFSITGTAADTSQPFLAWPDMSIQYIWDSGTTTDSIKMNCFLQYNLYGTDSKVPATSDAGWTYTVAGTDSIGYVLTADSTAGTAIVSAATTDPVRWCRLVITGITGNRVSAGVTGQARVLMYK